MSDKTTLSGAEKRQCRIDRGLCPECGEEAAPYYLCLTCRQLGSISRIMNRAADRGIVKKEIDGGKAYYSVPPEFNGRSTDEFHWAKTLFDMDPDDKRLRPRMGKRPVDLDETLIEIFETAGKRLQMHEIFEAWGRLRTKRKTASLAGDMRAIIEAQRRRGAKNAKRATIVARNSESMNG